jgi:hypothetical protein
VNAVRLHADWRPPAGIGPDQAGGMVERVIAQEVIARAVELHNKDVERAR